MIGNEIGVSGLRAPDSDLSFPKVHTDVCNIAELLQSQLSSGAAGTQGTKPTQGTPAGPRRRGGGASGPAPGVWGTASGRQRCGHTSLPQPPLGPSPAACPSRLPRPTCPSRLPVPPAASRLDFGPVLGPRGRSFLTPPRSGVQVDCSGPRRQPEAAPLQSALPASCAGLLFGHRERLRPKSLCSQGTRGR